jgi:glycosyltransferase involved in cell wall biosynthesis
MEKYLLSHRRLQTTERVVIPDFRPGPVDISQDSLKPYTELLPSVPYILFVGALRRVKGVQVLLDAYSALPGEPPPLVLIGSRAPDTPKVGPKVTMLHDWPFPAVLEAWRHCLFGVSPSIGPEPFGNVVHEGMSQGKAVIGTIPGGHQSMITDGETGLLIPGGNTACLRDAMIRLINDGEYRDFLGRNAQTRAIEFTADVCLPKFERFYEDTLNR